MLPKQLRRVRAAISSTTARAARGARSATVKFGPDAITVAGGSAVVGGVWMIFHAAAVILAGLLAMLAGYLLDARANPKGKA